MGKEKRCCWRAESSIRGADDLGRGVPAAGRDAEDGTLEPSEGNTFDNGEGTTSAESSVCVVKLEVLGLGATLELSSRNFSRRWRNERVRDAGFMRNAGRGISPCSPLSSMDRPSERALEYTTSSLPAGSRFELPLSMAMSSEGGRASASAGVDCKEGKLDNVIVGAEDVILGEAAGVSTGNTVS